MKQFRESYDKSAISQSKMAANIVVVFLIRNHAFILYHTPAILYMYKDIFLMIEKYKQLCMMLF